MAKKATKTLDRIANLAPSPKREGKARSTWNIKRLRYMEREYLSHALLIGQVALAWNGLHEILGSLFAALVSPRKAALVAWGSLGSDRSKRDMLSAVLKELEPKLRPKSPRLVSEIIWLLGRATALEDLRNDIIHAPLQQFGMLNWNANPDEDEVVTVIAPDRWGGNRRAAKLEGKDLLVEYRYCRDAIAELSAFALSLEVWLSERRHSLPWPNRPDTPARKLTKGKRTARRKKPPHRLPPILKAMLARPDEA